MSAKLKKQRSEKAAIISKKPSAFEKEFFTQIPVEDLDGWRAGEKAELARSMQVLARQRKAGQSLVRVSTPIQKRQNPQGPFTIVQMINDDMPFIVDSVAAELNDQGLSIEALFHPIIDGPRGAESMIYIQLEQVLSPELCRKLESRLLSVLADVKAATSDWKKMVAQLETVTEKIPEGKKNENVEAKEFLRYITTDNFTFLGYRRYDFKKSGGRVASQAAEKSGLGLLRKKLDGLFFGSGLDSPEIAALNEEKGVLVIGKLIDSVSTVHRRVPMDAVCVKIIDARGQLIGAHVFVGLFTSSTYSCRTSEVPLVREKVHEVYQRVAFRRGSHDRNALEHILEKFPRDELFQITVDDLKTIALGILRLQERQKVALYTRVDTLHQYVSCLVYVPRERYNTKFRMQVEKILEARIGGKSTTWFTTLDDSPLARVRFTIKVAGGVKPAYDHGYVEREILDLGQEWHERLKGVLVSALGKTRGTELHLIYGRAFTSAYHEAVRVDNAIHDVRHLESLANSNDPIRVEFYRLNDAPDNDLRLKVYHRQTPVPLSEILPVLENMGMKSLSETPFEVSPQGASGPIWIHDFRLTADAENLDLEQVKENIEACFLNVWTGIAENDGLNQLVLKANLTWREVSFLRACNGFLRQARFPFSREYCISVLAQHAEIASLIVELFEHRHDPVRVQKGVSRDVLAEKTFARIDELLQAVEKLDHDRILRSFRDVVEKMLRTNYFQKDETGAYKPWLAFKLDSKNMEDLPLPRPQVEIYVYSSRTEATHLRGGRIARGGIRWSDRHDDFRTEVLSLLKSQMVKNAVIVPVGAKGGFIVKNPPKEGGREALHAEAIACYKVMVQAMLDLTDNNIKGKIVRPAGIVCRDDVDPYLVVAADKGTATFSDIANSLSLAAGFWMGDAFASGGSAGYDHKGMGITARGAWESVKRHFRELGKDIQNEEFTAVGVGDMAGDVFGNGMLLSKKTLLRGAFNHLHIFCDPTPDAAKSFAERRRLFKARGGWDAYDRSLLSKGGAIYERSAKSIKLTPQIKNVFGISKDNVTPDELIVAMLTSETDLLWFGGIGTFIKAARQSHADADDKANDSIRVDAAAIRAKVVGEGANLGVTQMARVEYARLGGRINTDFIDNSGGVDCSDHEVNIKILLADVMAGGKMTLPRRNKLLADMTDEVAGLVLRDNYQQTQAISLSASNARLMLGLHAEFMRDLERTGVTKRSLESLPDDETIARLQKEGTGLTRPELAVLLSYSKILFKNDLLKSTVLDDPACETWLYDYFPKALQKYKVEISNHKLRREIIATNLASVLINRMDPMFVKSRMNKTGASPADVARAFLIAIEGFGARKLWQRIEDLDNKVPAQVQIDALNQVATLIKHVVTWLLRRGRNKLNITRDAQALRQGVDEVRKDIAAFASSQVKASFEMTESRLKARGVPADLAREIAILGALTSAPDIAQIARVCKTNVKLAAKTYFSLGERLHIDWLRQVANDYSSDNSWQARVISGLMDDFYAFQAALAREVVATAKKGGGDPVALWASRRGEELANVDQLFDELRLLPTLELAHLVVAGQKLRMLMREKD